MRTVELCHAAYPERAAAAAYKAAIVLSYKGDYSNALKAVWRSG